MYINGALVAPNTGVNIKPSTLGSTIGKSQWSVDSIIKGSIDEFKIYSRALDGTEIAGLANEGLLPVKLVSYTARLQSSGSVLLNWKTASEQNNAYFTVERSLNGKDFVQVGTNVQSKGNNGGSYSIMDNSAASGKNYYRLSQIDEDGTVTSLGTRVVLVTLGGKSFATYPNPIVGNSFTISLSAGESGDSLLTKITDFSGKILFSKVLKRNENGELKVELAEKPAAGMYIL